MISLRKLAFSFLAPIGALTIIGTGFATWTFSIGKVEVSENFQDNVNVTAEVENGDLEILSVPDMLVFSEGTQGKNDLFDGISFYTKKEIKNGANFSVTINNGTTHKLSFVYDNLTNTPQVYFSRSDSGAYTNIVSGTLTASDDVAGSYFGTWEGEGLNTTNGVYNVSLRLNKDYSGQISITDQNKKETIDTFTYKLEDSEIFPNITVTDSTFSFRYKYDNPVLVNEKETHYALNVQMGLFLESNDSFKFNVQNENGGTSLIGKPSNDSSKSITSFTLNKNNKNGTYTYDLELSINVADEPTTKINYESLTFISDGTGEDFSFPNGAYSGFSKSGIPCTLKIESNNSTGTQIASLKIGSMDHYLSLIDEYKNRTDEEGYFNIMSDENEDAIDTVLHMSIDKTHLTDKNPYLDFTCQLANYLRYESSDVKPTSPDKYLGLRVSSLLGGWKFRISINAFFTPI